MKTLIARAVLTASLTLAALPLAAQQAGTVEIYNFVDQEAVAVDPASLTPESAREYVPQIEEALAIYEHYLAQGDEPLPALLKSWREVLSALEAEVGSPGEAARD